jgi:hypothetical protein
MKIAFRLFLIIAMAAIAAAQSPAPPVSVACAKTISFAMAEGGQPVPAIPKFAAKWIGKKYHVEGHPELCLSQIPSASTANYVMIFSTSEASFDGLSPTAHTYTSSGPMSGNLAGISSYGGTWNYSYTGVLPPATTSSIDLQRIDASKKVLVIRAYSQQGRQVSHSSVDSDHSREKLLEQVIADIHRDVMEAPEHKRITAPLSVYYVNCDVDSPTPAMLTASANPPTARPEPKPPAPTPPQATLDISSDPAGADIYLDGSYLGKSPFTAIVAPGEHVVLMRKAEFGTWQRKIQIAPGPRRVTAYLERQLLTFPSGQ